MSFSDLLESGLDLPDGIVLQLLNLFQSGADHTKRLRIDPSGGKELIDLGILCLISFLNRLQLLFKEQVLETSLLMNFINDLVEFLKQLLLLLLKVLELLELDLVLPLDLLVLSLSLHNLVLSHLELLLDGVASFLLFGEVLDVFLKLLHWLHNIVVGSLLTSPFLIGLGLVSDMSFQILPQGLNHIHVGPGDLEVVLLDVGVLLGNLLLESLNSLVLLGLDFGNLLLSLLLGVLTEQSHLVFVFELDFVGDTLLLFPDGGGLGDKVLVESNLVVFLSGLLLFGLHLEGTQVLLELTLVDSVLVLSVLQTNLGLKFDHGLLIQVLEHEMLQSLSPDLDGDGVLLLQILELTVLVSQLGLLVFKILLGNEPEIVEPESLINEKSSQLLL